MVNIRGYVDGVLINAPTPDSEVDMLLRSAFPTTATTQNTYIMSGSVAVGDYGTGAIYSRTINGVAATSGGPMAIQDANSVWFNLVIIDKTINVKHWGAKGDGVDDGAALDVASQYAITLGSGTTVLFPAGGHYKWVYPGGSAGYPNMYTADGIAYVGEGWSSWYETQWHGFWGQYETLHDSNADGGIADPVHTYYLIANIAAGDQFIDCTIPAQAANFAPGDFVFIRSNSHIFNDNSPTVNVYTFMEINIVKTVNSTTGVITLEDPISDKCTDAPRVTNYTNTIPRNNTFRNMRITVSQPNGYPFAFVGMYKALVDSCWIEGGIALTNNGFTRSIFRNNYVDIRTSASRGWMPAYEVKLGSSNSIIENNVFVFQSTDGTWPTLYAVSVGESARRIHDRNNKWIAPGQTLTNVGGAGIARGFIQENAYVECQNLTYIVIDQSGRTENDDIPNVYRNYTLDVPGTVDTGISLLNPKNTHISGINFRGTVTTAAVVYDVWVDAQSMDGILIENVHLNGPVTQNHAPAYSNCVIRDSSFSSLDFGGVPGVKIEAGSVRQFGTNISLADSANIRQHAAYTLSSTASAQHIFNGSTSGAVTLPVGAYFFEGLVSLSGMSVTSGNAAFSIEPGTGTVTNFLIYATAVESGVNAIAAWQGSVANSKIAPANMATAAIGTDMQFKVSGSFEVTAAGTVIPSVTLANAASAAVRIGSYFTCWRMGADTDVTFGNWS